MTSHGTIDYLGEDDRILASEIGGWLTDRYESTSLVKADYIVYELMRRCMAESGNNTAHIADWNGAVSCFPSTK